MKNLLFIIILIFCSCSKSYNTTTPIIPSIGNTNTISISNQQWMGKNLDVSTYQDGTVIPQVTDANAWAGLTTGAWCYYNNDPINGAIYGKLYNWHAVNDPRGLAPKGWHIASDAEWTNLTANLGGESRAGGRMKTTGTTLWNSPNITDAMISGYAGLPGGLRSYSGAFKDVGYYAYWWSASECNSTSAWYRGLNNSMVLTFAACSRKTDGFSVRCLKD